jgi:hypothetical protein
VLDTTDESRIEKFLGVDEKILWIARPERKSFQLTNIERMFFDSLKQILFIFLFLEIYDFIFHGELFMQTDFPIFKFAVPGTLLINVIRVIIRIIHLDKIMYCVTDRRIFSFSDIERQKLETVEKLKIKEKKITAAGIEKIHKVHTIKLVTDNGNVLLESIDNRLEI